MAKHSAGLLMFRRTHVGPEVLLVHPGGPFWAKKDEGAWTIPKGEPAEGEELLNAAQREFSEETATASTTYYPLSEQAWRRRSPVEPWPI